MDFAVFKDRLVAAGYSDDTAYARIAHDIVLKAVRDSGFHDNLTVKGGVVMSAITDIARRATMDMDLDFLRYPLSNDGIRKFVSGLNRVAPCRIRISGRIETLRQQEYRGKRIHLTRDDVKQANVSFRIVTDNKAISLLANPGEQIFVEKLKSLLRFGSASTRFKDIFDIYFLSRHARMSVVRKLLKAYIFDDSRMRENSIYDIVDRLGRIFGNRTFMRNLSRPVNAWLDVAPEEAVSDIVAFISSLE